MPGHTGGDWANRATKAPGKDIDPYPGDEAALRADFDRAVNALNNARPAPGKPSPRERLEALCRETGAAARIIDRDAFDRCFGLWQVAYASREALNATNYAAARAAMMDFRASGGRKLGIMPNLLVVPPSLESAGRKLLNSELGAAGESNEWKGTAELLVTPWLG